MVAKPQWKAAIDFKWIRENKDLVAGNIRNRNSSANLDLVLELYEKYLGLQKVRVILFFTLIFITLLGFSLFFFVVIFVLFFEVDFIMDWHCDKILLCMIETVIL